MTSSTTFFDLAEICEKLEKTSKRLELASILAEFLKTVNEDEIRPTVLLIIGKIFTPSDPRSLEIGVKTLIKTILKISGITKEEYSKEIGKFGDIGDATASIMSKGIKLNQKTLFEVPRTIKYIFSQLLTIVQSTGPGSRKKKEKILENLFLRSTPIEAKYLVRIILQNQRIGVYEGILEEAISKAFHINLNLIKRANMILGDIGEVARVALTEGVNGLREKAKSPILFTPLKPTLAVNADNIFEVLEQHNYHTAFELKLDGARVQIHKRGDEVRIFSRNLANITQSLPDIVEQVRESVMAKTVILDGEVIGMGPDDKPLPFQYLMKRFRRVHRIQEMIKEIPVKLYLFDILLLDDKNLIDLSYYERREILKDVAGNISLVESLTTDEVDKAEEFLNYSINSGHEGLIAKKMDSKYFLGTRGKNWIKIKRIDNLDLVIVAADWGYGRRKDWLSDYYLAAYDPDQNDFSMVGKTYKGLTDEEFETVTKRLKENIIEDRGKTVIVKPEIVVEVAFDEIQKSSNYPSGYALRFARIINIRSDKSPNEADSVSKVRTMFEKQFEKKSRLVN